ncbi:hypothetical protein BV22DRAFT_1016990 [Leucogyrophana mollusca]|uniref:Uncharacterized protein n=1 Tax=Leucogyrophana mollusca TaxID=85980 RepID=A0ACB8BA80_9AGAM|nr:hypothetical protein BV22DRAFT_1016990 [Leucogyrophana mollusca]
MSPGLIRLPVDAEAVGDADEEIFIAYTNLQQAKTVPVGPDGFRGLGHVDSRKDTLFIQFELKSSVGRLTQTDGAATRRGKAGRKSKEFPASTKTIEVELAQDKTALRSRKGDTGSVLWRASVEFAQLVLQQHFFPPDNPLFERAELANSHVLELGAGTGLLGVALSPLVRSYTVTDIGVLLPLIRKNVALNFPGWPHSNGDGSSGGSGVFVEELDWVTVHSSPAAVRTRYCPTPSTASSDSWDFVLVVDCIYHPSLLPALVETIDVVSTCATTWVLVVVELRQEDVVREFLDLWLRKGEWTLWRLDNILGLHYGVWAGQKRRNTHSES